MQMVLTKAGWAEFLCDTEKARVALVKQFFEHCTTEKQWQSSEKRATHGLGAS